MVRNSKVKIVKDKVWKDRLKEKVSEKHLKISKELDDIENGRIKFKKFNSISKLMEDLKN